MLTQSAGRVIIDEDVKDWPGVLTGLRSETGSSMSAVFI